MIRQPVISTFAELVRKDSTKRVLAISRPLFVAFALAAIFWFLIRNRAQVVDLVRSATFAKMVFPMIFLGALHLLVAAGFHFVHSALGVNRPYWAAVSSYFLRLPARYIPGGIWHTAARYMDIPANDTTGKRAIGRIFVVECSLVALTGSLVGAIGARIWLSASSVVSALSLIAIVVSLVLTAAVIFATAKGDFRRVGGRLLLAWAFFIANWVGVSLAFSMYFRALSVTRFADCSMAAVATAYDISATLGYVVVVAPQGWGVAEFVFGNLQVCGASAAAGVTALTGFRLLALLADMLAYGATLLVVCGFAATPPARKKSA